MNKNSENISSANKSSASFEEAIKELEAIVRRLEGGSGNLESSINDYVRGTELKNFCDSKLKEARLKVEAIVKSEDGSITTREFEEK